MSHSALLEVDRKIAAIEDEQKQLERQGGNYHQSATYQQNIGQVRALAYIRGWLLGEVSRGAA